MTLQAGIKLGPYEIVASLGTGGMGEVYRARDNRLGREVAVKVLPPHLAKNSEALGRFEREARALAALSHPNILTLFDFGNENGVVFAVMELLEGITLRDRLKEGSVPIAETLEIGAAIADGLAAAHSRGVIHRDLKPENIFITTDGWVKILDFGLVHWNPEEQSSEVTHLPTAPLYTKSGMVMGTVHYMSPEQVRGASVDERTDIFSLGIVLYEMIHGSRPFTADTMVETMVAIMKEDPARPATPVPLPRDLMKIVHTCLEKEPGRRFSSALDLATSLRQVAAGTPLSVSLSPRSGVRRQRRKKAIDSIAILPFTNASDNPETDYLCDGITETIINNLSQIPALRVMARSTVFVFKGKNVDPREVGRDLGVRAILTGRLVQRDDNLNVQVELVDGDDGARLWGDQFNQKVCDIQSLQQEIAQSISGTLKPRLAGEDKRKLTKRYTENVEAYNLYLQGRYFWNTRTEEGLRRGMELFEQAIQVDPEFALAYAGLADSYSLLGGFYFMQPSAAYPKAKETALKALRMDPGLAEAYTSLATVKERYDWDWNGAGRAFRKALKLNPGYALGRLWYAIFLILMGRFREGDSEMNKALDLDPMSVNTNWARSYTCYYMRDYDKAIQYSRRTLEMDPSFHRARFDLALSYLMMGKKDQALHTFEEWSLIKPDSPGMFPLQGYYFAVAGEREKAGEMIRRCDALQEGKYISRFSIAMIHVALGNYDSAFLYLDRAIENHEDPLVSLKVNPRLDPIRPDSRFQDLLRRTGLS